MLKKFVIQFTLIYCAFSTFCLAADWQSDPAKSSLLYTADFKKTPMNGTFKEFSVSYSVNDNGKPSRLEVRVSTNSADMGNSDINKTIRSSEWFNVAQYPQADFASDSFKAIIKSKGKNDFIADGTLQLKGIKRSVSVPFSWQEMSDGNALMTGNLILNRNDFSIGTGEWSSGEKIRLAVKVWFNVLLIRSKKE